MDRGLLPARTFAMCMAGAFLASGIPWWLAPYNRFTFSHPAAILGFLAFVGLAAWFAGGTELGFGRTVLAAGAAVPAAVMVRVVVDTAKDPTSHNLWPFEVAFTGVFAFGLAAGAGLLGLLFRRLLR
jgi:hypothetical protein